MTKHKPKLFRIATVPISLNLLLKGQLKYLNERYVVTAIASAGTALDEVAKREGVHIKAITIARKISILSDIKALWQLYRYFKKEKPAIVHSITPKAGLLSMLAAYWARVPVRMHTFTGLIFPTKNGFLQKILIAMDRLLCFCATHIYPEGQGVKNDLINYKITSKPLKILASGSVNGIDLDYYKPDLFSSDAKEKLRKKLQISNEDTVFTFVGRLVGDKGINELVAAFESLNAQYPDVKLLLVGPEEKQLDPLQETTVLAIKNNKNIITTGWQADIRPYLSITTIFVFPSYREGMPNVVLQAGAMSLPSIVTDINGSNEIITDKKNGLIIPDQDIKALYEAMENLLEDESLRAQLAAHARDSIKSRYSQETVYEALLLEYELVNELISQ